MGPTITQNLKAPTRVVGVLLATAFLVAASSAHAEVQRESFGAGGYFRIMTRPDFQGGDSRLGLWNLYGRLLNEGPWGALELRLDLLQSQPGTQEIWSSVHAKIEGGSFANADAGKGSLENFAVTRLYLEAGNILLPGVVWRLGTLDFYFGDLGLYDMRPAQLFFETVGLSAQHRGEWFDVLVGIGDSGYFIRGEEYASVLTAGGAVRARAGAHVELGVGGQVLYEPKVRGNRFAPHQTRLPGGLPDYEDFFRGRVVQEYNDAFPDEQFPKPTPVDALSYKLIAYVGFGGLGPLRWNNLFANYLLRHPDNVYVEGEQPIHIKELTDERFEINVGNEMQLTLVPKRLDAVWGIVAGHHENRDNTIVAGEDNRTFYSTVLRLQAYATETVHFLLESSVAREKSNRGNLWRQHWDSVFTSEDGLSAAEGLENGDTDRRDTWQIKGGLVLNPTGLGVYTRPSIRLLYGLQHSNVHASFGNGFSQSLDQYDAFVARKDRHWHSVFALEVEGWF